MKRSTPVLHRCPAPPRRSALIRIAALALAPGLPALIPAALAQAPGTPVPGLRQIPADARYGEFEILAYPEATIDGKTVRLAAGAQIRDARNMIALPSTVSGRHPALYRLDPSGQLSRVWLLAPGEIEAARARPTGD
ncbi:hypothetical protein [Zeimonas arvi]|uniref:Uncharacterized protein n=1 Tax=Zeimonas arvi TaxID=2498847 RepID=A0A5C8P4S0_9BURK|nr:hypothetical protein [Zeimonas arvi]TXL68479.1 hypothetical protein FHP08_02005 [Zeimonas arvi]